MTYLKAASEERRGNTSPAELKDMIRALPAKIEEDAIWARKRGMLDERFERATTALNRLVASIEKNPDEVLPRIFDAYNFKDISFRTAHAAGG